MLSNDFNKVSLVFNKKNMIKERLISKRSGITMSQELHHSPPYVIKT